MRSWQEGRNGFQTNDPLKGIMSSPVSCVHKVLAEFMSESCMMMMMMIFLRPKLEGSTVMMHFN